MSPLAHQAGHPCIAHRPAAPAPSPTTPIATCQAHRVPTQVAVAAGRAPEPEAGPDACSGPHTQFLAATVHACTRRPEAAARPGEMRAAREPEARTAMAQPHSGCRVVPRAAHPQ